MGRLGVLYALTEAELQKLLDCPQEERYDYMLEEIEETLLGTPVSYTHLRAHET